MDVILEVGDGEEERIARRMTSALLARSRLASSSTNWYIRAVMGTETSSGYFPAPRVMVLSSLLVPGHG